MNRALGFEGFHHMPSSEQHTGMTYQHPLGDIPIVHKANQWLEAAMQTMARNQNNPFGPSPKMSMLVILTGMTSIGMRYDEGINVLANLNLPPILAETQEVFWHVLGIAKEMLEQQPPSPFHPQGAQWKH